MKKIFVFTLITALCSPSFAQGIGREKSSQPKTVKSDKGKKKEHGSKEKKEKSESSKSKKS